MKAYAVFDGGGFKGAALAGCLKAAEAHNIQFEGYGGTSAGSIVATLASVGYGADEIWEVLKELDATIFFDDSGTILGHLQRITWPWISAPRFFSALRAVQRIRQHLGLYNGFALRRFLLSQIARKFQAVEHRNDVSFQELRELGGLPLKIVATDLGSRRAVVHSAMGGHDLTGSVVDAVRASTSYPFVFEPVRINDRYLVDGGLCSNLPAFVFEDERRESRLPVIAFDLMQRPPDIGGEYGIGRFCGDLIATALESPDILLRSVLQGVLHVQIPIPSKFETLKPVSLSEAEELYEIGFLEANRYFSERVPQWSQTTSEREILQALSVPQQLVKRALEGLAKDFERQTFATNVRANIMLPTQKNTRIIAYQFGMDSDDDRKLELAMDAGCTGAAWTAKRPVAADLLTAKETYEDEWHMTTEQQAMIRQDRKAMFSFPMFDLTDAKVGAVEDLRLLGVMSVDTDQKLTDTGWVDTRRRVALEIGKEWADILSRLLT